MHNKWNPYSEEVSNIPWIYWIMAFNFLQIKATSDWDNKMLPHAEMIGQLTHPEIFTEYKKHKDKMEKREKLGKGQDYYESTVDGVEGGGTANAHFDPNIGLVDDKGRVVVPKEEYERMIGMEGVAISW